ncbi:MAG: PhnA domain-containing protein [Thiotrichaceae bacterium]|nr:PhnA domain-containing protein [Thiotrichaceae bacterium]
MSLIESLKTRADSQCELCQSKDLLDAYSVPPSENATIDQSVLLCSMCLSSLNATEASEHWRCLSDTMWSTEPAVQVMAWRLLTQLNEHAWANGLLDGLYLEDDVLQWAQSIENSHDDDQLMTRDSNGAPLATGDSVTLIKDLVVKGANFTAKRGTSVKNIRLTDNPLHIEGKVNGTQIVLVSAFLKKQA